MRQEVALARAELTREIAETGKTAGVFAGAGLAGVFTLLFGSLAVWAGLSTTMRPGWAALLITVFWALTAIILHITGRVRTRRISPRPTRTLDTLSQVPDALKGHRGGPA